jgi:4-alpha-glucanotransferase
VAGVPPDYFSATGQLWGNPLYDWEAVERDGWRFWIDRVRGALATVDRIRLDHFRGFEAYWELPAGAATAQEGRWAPGPGARLFEALERTLLGPARRGAGARAGGRDLRGAEPLAGGGEPALPFIAENLGVITPEVEALRRRFRLPGMAILQFAFGNDPQAPTFLPHAYERDTVAYTGTHDNDTVMGWWLGGAEGSVRTAEDVEREKARARAYLATDGREMNWVMIRALLASVADSAIVPLQDVLGLGSEARMNRPATLGGNWTWRFREDALGARESDRLAELVELYGRGGPKDSG